MGFLEGQRAKHDERMRRAVAEKLRPEETVNVQVAASSNVSWLRFFLAVFPGVFLLEYTGRGAYSSWIIGLAVGLWIGIVTRQYILVLTNQRFLALRLKRLSSKNVDDVSGCELNELKGAEFKMSVMTGKLTLKCGASEQNYRVARIYEDRAKQLELAITPR